MNYEEIKFPTTLDTEKKLQEWAVRLGVSRNDLVEAIVETAVENNLALNDAAPRRNSDVNRVAPSPPPPGS